MAGNNQNNNNNNNLNNDNNSINKRDNIIRAKNNDNNQNQNREDNNENDNNRNIPSLNSININNSNNINSVNNSNNINNININSEDEFLYEKRFEHDIIDDEKCNICNTNFKNDDIIKKMQCGHIYHKFCHDKFKERQINNANYPLCLVCFQWEMQDSINKRDN